MAKKKKKSQGSSVREKPIKKKGRSTLVRYDDQALARFFAGEDIEPYEIEDREIDYSDIPELTSEQLKKAKRPRVGRPTLGVAPRKTISIKLDPVLLNEAKRQAKALGKGYQTYIHEILEEHILKA